MQNTTGECMMCGITRHNGKEGISFKDGTFISFEEFTIDVLSEKHLKELEEMKILNEAVVRKRLHQQGNILQKIISRLDLIDEKLSELSEYHENNFPEYVNKRYKRFSESLKIVSDIAKSIGIIFAIISGFGYVLYLLINLAPR